MEIVRENSDDQHQQLNDAENEEMSDAEQNEDDFTYEEEESTKKRSPLWQHFSVLIDRSGKRFAKCNHCVRKYQICGKSNGGTGNMARHMKNKHSNIVLIETVNEEGPFVFSQQKFRKALMKWVVTCDQPFTAAREPAFIELVDSLNPDAHIVSDKTIKADELAEYLLKFDELKKDMSQIPGKISITMDGWTSKNSLPFLAIRGHWLNCEWKYQTKLLDFAYIEGKHSGQRQSEILIDVLQRLGIPFGKILAITLDNATNNDTLFDFLQAHGITAIANQVRCMAHIINLGVQDILAELKVPTEYAGFDPDENLENEELEDIDLNLEIYDDVEEIDVPVNDGAVVEKLRKLVRKIRTSVQLRQKLKKICESYDIKYLVPVIDITTRWNSTFHMMLRAKVLRVPLRHLCQNEKQLNSLWLASMEWQELEKIEGLLEKFERSTKLVSMERRPTNSKYLPTINWLIEVLKEYTAEHFDGLAEAVNAGITKLQKYETLINETSIPFICTFLHPALKLNYFKEYYAKNAVREINSKISSYFLENYSNVPPKPSQTKLKRKTNQTDEENDEFSVHLFKRSKRTNESSEMKKYIDQTLSKPEVDILDFWKSRKEELPLLSAMARDFLPIQSSSVAVERDFSSGVDVVTPNRHRLLATTIQTKMCLKSW